MNEIFISCEFLDSMIAHARESFPMEACGILTGIGNTAVRLYRMKNVEESSLKYGFDATEQFRVMKEAEKEGLRIVAIYHSHPCSAPYPSVVDIKRAFFPGTSGTPSMEDENFPGVAYLIIGFAGSAPDVKAYLINKDGVKKVNIASP